MLLRTVRLLWLLCCLAPWHSPAESANHLSGWEDGETVRKVGGLHQREDFGNVVWSDGNEIQGHTEQVQNVFKRFLFHYSKAHNVVGAVRHQSQSVHPLMHLSPKLSQRRKKQLVLMRVQRPDWTS